MSQHQTNQHEELMALLHQVPGVTEHLESFTVLMGKKILQRRMALGLTQTELAQLVSEKVAAMTQATISKVEAGHEGIKGETYNKLFHALGELEDVTPVYKGEPDEGALLR